MNSPAPVVLKLPKAVTLYSASHCSDYNHEAISLLLHNCNCASLMNPRLESTTLSYSVLYTITNMLLLCLSSPSGVRKGHSLAAETCLPLIAHGAFPVLVVTSVT